MREVYDTPCSEEEVEFKEAVVAVSPMLFIPHPLGTLPTTALSGTICAQTHRQTRKQTRSNTYITSRPEKQR